MTNKGPKLIRERKDSSRKEITELRQENNLLRKKISRLQKQVQRESSEISADPEPSESGTFTSPTSLICPNCNENGEIGAYKTPGGATIYGCKICKKFKKRVEQ